MSNEIHNNNKKIVSIVFHQKLITCFLNVLNGIFYLYIIICGILKLSVYVYYKYKYQFPVLYNQNCSFKIIFRITIETLSYQIIKSFL